KKEKFKIIFSKKDFSLLDVMNCSKMLVGKEDEDTFVFNQKLHSFDKESILKILDYQKEHNYSNSEVARYFKISRNTIASWKKRFV
ncbi:helix-turn-helix domain-containing protein, partial [Chryseobacterium sp. IT-36CA2]|uniref:helix-turn-helix domain-containing protein n=1 Tax=Chryseobacterium sp. IT-36CA2 TaxID=3026460 RepID=UPI0039E0D50B